MPQLTAPYGSWRSPVTSDLIVTGTTGLRQIVLDRDAVYWLESRPTEGGRNVVVRRTAHGAVSDLTPPPFNVRTRVHEYGGGAYTVAGGAIYFANDRDQRLYVQQPGQEPQPITPPVALRYADLQADLRRSRLLCVREDHTQPGEAVNTLVSVSLPGDAAGGTVLVSGNDFYASPRLSPDGERLAWLTWNHPNMPWDGCELWVAAVQPDGSLAGAQRVAGGPAESVYQPEWSPDGTLYFVSDRTGWWNLYRLEPHQATPLEMVRPKPNRSPVFAPGSGGGEPICEMPAEFGAPQWSFGQSNYAFESAQRIVCSYVNSAGWHLATLDTATHSLHPLDLPYSDISSVQAGPGHACFVAGSPTKAPQIVQLDLGTGRIETLRCSSAATIDPGYISIPRAIEFPTAHGQTAHGFYYPPQNKDYVAPAGELPPLIVESHGGPTGSTDTMLDLERQFWTSRGFTVLDVNYGGSTRYGRAYRERLKGQWGVVDVDDCVHGARFLVEQGLADSRRLIIHGGSAGGYTTLAALTFRDVFSAGASYYGISDLEAMAKDTHKFESRYLDGLIGPYPARRDLYLARSPIHFTDRLSCPVIFFQGLEDKVVPPNQAEMMIEALRAKGLPVASLFFAGEQHGFRQAQTIKRALDAELYFYSRVFGFALAEPVEPVPIENLPG